MNTDNLNIGITIKLKDINESLWTNGMKLNILMFINMLKNSNKNYNVYLLNVDKLDYKEEELPQTLKDVNFGLLDSKYHKLDLLISMGAQVQPHIIKFMNKNNKKVVNYKCGNNYILSLENMLFKESPNNYPIFDDGVDEVWYVPQQHETNQGFFRTLYRCNSLPVPFIWDYKYIEQSLESIDNQYKLGKYKKDRNYDLNKEKRTIGVMEPNINMVKFGLIPSMIAEECYRGDIGKEKIESLMITNSSNVMNHKEFMGIIKKMDLYKDGKISAESRYQTAFIVSQYLDVVVSHQVLNPLNYLYLDVAYMGYPVLHNAPLAKDIGYYYEGSDTRMAAKQLEHILMTHQDNIEEYKERNRKAIQRYLVNDERLITSYDKLIFNLFNGGNKEGLEYCPKTNSLKGL
jgi:hypothetical protein